MPKQRSSEIERERDVPPTCDPWSHARVQRAQITGQKLPNNPLFQMARRALLSPMGIGTPAPVGPEESSSDELSAELSSEDSARYFIGLAEQALFSCSNLLVSFDSQ